MKNILILSVLTLMGLHLTAQSCTSITASSANGQAAPINTCVGQTITYSATVSNVINATSVDWYIGTSSSFNPYAGQGTLIGSSPLSANCPTTCPDLLAIFINACNGTGVEEDNEYIVFSSGGGFNTSNLQVDLPNSNGTGNSDINLGATPCGLQTPQAALITALRTGSCNATNILPAGPSTQIPAGAIVILFTSNNVTASYNLNSLCSTGQTIYIMQSACDRSGGAFVNAGTAASDTRTTTISLSNCPSCSDALTYDRLNVQNTDGVYAFDNGNAVSTVANGGVTINPVAADRCNGPVFTAINIPTTVDVELDYTVPNTLCGAGPYYVVGVINPAPTLPCPQTFTNYLQLNVSCPTVDAGNNINVCGTVTSTITAVGATGVTPYTYNWNQGLGTGASHTVSPASTTTYNVTLTDAFSCTATDNITINVSSAATTSITPSNPALTCTTTSVTLTASGGGTYLWSTGETTASINATTAGVRSVTVTVAGGCTATASVNVTANQTAPVAAINPASASLSCATLSATLTASGGGTYSWSTTETTAAITVNSAATYRVTVTGANGCTATAQSVVSSNQTPPIITLTPSSGNLTCANPTISLVVTGGGAYSWNTGATSSTLVANAAGTYIITVTAANGCTASAQSIITSSISSPVASITPSNPVLTCTTPSTTLTASGGGTYLWSTGETTASITATTAGVRSVTVTAAGGCTATASVTITANQTAPIASINPASATLTCTTPTATLTASGGGTYSWSTTETTAAITVNSAATYSVTVTSANGCTATAQSVVTNSQTPPAITLTPSSGNLTCASPVVTLVATGGGSYSWNTSASTSTLAVNVAGTYIVTVTAANGCTASAQSIITSSIVPPVISITPTTAELTCTTPTATFTATGGVSYVWSNSTNNAAVNAALSGPLSVTVTDAGGCTASAQVNVTSNQTPPSAAITVSAPTLNCANAFSVLQVPTGNSYIWSNSVASATNTVNAAGNYSVTVTAANGCTASAQTIIAQAQPLTASISTTAINCADATDGELAVNVLTGSAPYTYFWSNNATTSSIQNLSAGNYIVTVNDAGGCTTLLLANLSNPAAFSVQASPQDTTITMGTTVDLSVTGNAGATYQWQPAATLSASNTQTVTATPNTETTYTVTVTDVAGCTATSSAIVRLEGECVVKLPNAFSPNGDGNNDVFRLLVSSPFTVIEEFAIFDRWGNKIFSTNNAQDSWNGKSEGRECPTDVYVYYVRYHCPTDNKSILLSGDVTLLR